MRFCIELGKPIETINGGKNYLEQPKGWFTRPCFYSLLKQGMKGVKKAYAATANNSFREQRMRGVTFVRSKDSTTASLSKGIIIICTDFIDTTLPNLTWPV